MSLEEKIIQVFECPVCFNYMAPPIRQCAAGHVICHDCFRRINVCPQCRGPKEAMTVHILERMYLKLKFPCKYKFEGCEVSTKGLIIERHEKACDFATRRCPFHLGNNCHWQGSRQRMVDHCMLQHPEYTFFEPMRMVVSSMLKTEIENRRSVIVFNVFDNIFRLHWRLEGATIKVRMGYYGHAASEHLFSYELCVLDSEKRLIRLREPCVCFANDTMEDSEVGQLRLNFDAVREYCREDGDLFHIVRIIKE